MAEYKLVKNVNNVFVDYQEIFFNKRKRKSLKFQLKSTVRAKACSGICLGLQHKGVSRCTSPTVDSIPGLIEFLPQESATKQN